MKSLNKADSLLKIINEAKIKKAELMKQGYDFGAKAAQNGLKPNLSTDSDAWRYIDKNSIDNRMLKIFKEAWRKGYYANT